MPEPVQSAETRLRTAEAWWAFAARIIAFFFGAFLIYHQATVPNPPGAQESLIAVGVMFMGPAAAALFASTVEKVRAAKDHAG